ncbi:hypothetical protein GF318_03645 [Candidatus Micrarchaeota archaeon]|nr:hypothetical protein [Candidatus Micrarchaeota archaeon]
MRSAIIDIVNAEGETIQRDRVSPGQTKEFSVAGESYKLHVYQTFDGHADIALLSRELELEDGEELNLDDDDNPNYTVALGWKNLGASGTASGPDALRTIIVYSGNIEDLSASGSRNLEAGDFVPIVENPASWRLYYQGLESGEFINFRFSLEEYDRMISESRGPVMDGVQVACLIRGAYLHVQADGPGAVFMVERTDAEGQSSSNEFFCCTCKRGSLRQRQ